MATAPQHEQIGLVLDGLEETPSHRAAVVACLQTLSAAAAVSHTSRPSAVQDGTIVTTARLGCKGRRSAYLTPAMVQELGLRILRRFKQSRRRVLTFAWSGAAFLRHGLYGAVVR